MGVAAVIARHDDPTLAFASTSGTRYRPGRADTRTLPLGSSGWVSSRRRRLLERDHDRSRPRGPGTDGVPAPPGGKGPIVVLLSGHSGPDYYQPIAGAVARLGYYAVLLDGKDILTREQDGRGNLSRAIARAHASPHALPGKTVVIGFSQGGGAALVHAADMPEVVSAVVAYYPQTNFVADASLIARRFQVPVLILAGQRDTYHNCCLIESMRAIERGARVITSGGCPGGYWRVVVYLTPWSEGRIPDERIRARVTRCLSRMVLWCIPAEL